MNEAVEKIKAVADKTEDFSYMKQFTPEELEGKQTELTSESIALRKKRMELKALSKDLRDAIKKHETKVDSLVVELQNKARAVTEPCYVEIDRTLLMAKYYSSDTGDLVYERPATKDEMQLRIPYRMAANE